ncbi:MAG: hypothetical protein B7Z80_16370, partial [Rhodospirillales bacterium 20-64-7]
TGGVTEAFKTGQSPGAQTNDNLLAGSPANIPAGAAPTQPGQPGQPTPPAPAPSVDKQLGGLY